MGQRRGGGVHDPAAALPRPQAVVDVLVGHAVGLVEQADLGQRVARDVHAGAGDAERGLHHRGGREVGLAEAEAVVEPLRGARVADGARELDRVVGVEELAADDAGALALRRGLVGGVLEHLDPARVRDAVGVDEHGVLPGTHEPQAAVAVGGEPGLALPQDDLGPLEVSQPRDVLGGGAVVGDDDPHAPAVGGAPHAAHGGLDQRRVPVGRDHDDHGPPVAPVPGAGRPRGVVQARAEAEPGPEGGQAQGEGRQAPQRLPDALIAQRQVRALGQVGEQPAQVAQVVGEAVGHQAGPGLVQTMCREVPPSRVVLAPSQARLTGRDPRASCVSAPITTSPRLMPSPSPIPPSWNRPW